MRHRDLGDLAAATTYFGFTSLPAILLITVGLFASIAGNGAVDELVDRLGNVAPGDVVSVVDRILTSTVSTRGAGWLVLAGVGLALWSATGAMTTLMKGLNAVSGCEDGRSFVRRRLVAAAMIGLVAAAVALVSTLLLAGPWLSGAAGRALGGEAAIRIAWQVVQWPIVFAGLFAVAAALLALGPARRSRQPGALAIGAAVTVVGWVGVSALFSVYLTRFGSYDRAWGPLAAVIVTLIWLWVSAYALLVGGAVAAAIGLERPSSASSRGDLLEPAGAGDERPARSAAA